MQKNQEQKTQQLFTIIHFNDVYDIQPKGGSMGVCNFKALLQQLRFKNPKSVTLFSGDCLSPSTLTNIKQGWQMVHALNTLSIDVACYGNHEFDFDREHTMKLVKQTNFPWLLGNIFDKKTGKTLGEGLPYIIKQLYNIKVGIMGVVGHDWIGILNDDYEDQLEYEDCFDFANKTAKYLRQQQKCELIIALTHMRNGADRQFPMKVSGVDIVLGGHDHVIMDQFINGVPVIKSGTNFNTIGQIKVYSKNNKGRMKGPRFQFQNIAHPVHSSIKIDLQLKSYVDKLMEQYSKFDQIVGYTEVPLQQRFTVIRREQSNYGNFLADLSRLYYDSDFCAINSGMVRNDIYQPVGRLTYSKVSNIIDSPMVVKRLTGKSIFQMLELSVGQYPNFSGQFLFISGFRFQFDPKKSPRVQKIYTMYGDQLENQKQYTLCTTSFQSRGGDGFTMLKGGEMIVDQVKATTMLNLLLKFFKAPDTHQEYESIKLLQKQPITSQHEELPQFPEQHLVLVRKVSVRMGRIKDLRSRFVLSQQGKKLTTIAPKTDGRIKCIQ